MIFLWTEPFKKDYNSLLKNPIYGVAPVAPAVSVQDSTPPLVARSRLVHGVFQQTDKRLPENIQEKIPVVLTRFSENRRHPSLHVKKMEGHADVWEMRISDSYRLTFQIVREGTLLRRIGTHDILRTP